MAKAINESLAMNEGANQQSISKLDTLRKIRTSYETAKKQETQFGESFMMIFLCYEPTYPSL